MIPMPQLPLEDELSQLDHLAKCFAHWRLDVWQDVHDGHCCVNYFPNGSFS